MNMEFLAEAEGGSRPPPKERDYRIFGSASGIMKHYLMHRFL